VVADTGNNRVVVHDGEGDLVVADTANRRVVTVRGALPGHWGIWLPLVSRTWRAK
jgi:hypothetical protein